jgi:hypothetical protein
MQAVFQGHRKARCDSEKIVDLSRDATHLMGKDTLETEEPKPCWACGLHHVQITEDPYEGLQREEPEFECVNA